MSSIQLQTLMDRKDLEEVITTSRTHPGSKAISVKMPLDACFRPAVALIQASLIKYEDGDSEEAIRLLESAIVELRRKKRKVR